MYIDWLQQPIQIILIISPEVNHIDGNKLNNSINNLEWVSSSQNQIHAINNGLKNNLLKPVYQFNAQKELVAIYKSLVDVQKAGFTKSLVQQELQTKEKTLTLGFFWNTTEDAFFPIKKTKNTGKNTPIEQLNIQENVIAIFPSMKKAATAVGGSHSHISECCRGKIKTYKGYKWKKVKDDIV